MSSAISVLACDVGAGSGRILQVEYHGSHLDLNQVTRFRNGPIKVGHSLYWDVLGIYRGLQEGLVKASNQGIKAVSLGIDTWGNDFILLDKKGFLIENLYSYRDSRTEEIIPYVGRFISDYDLYLRNGIQQVRMNTLYQLVSLAKERPYIFDIADHFLFIPDLLQYFLTGEIHSEYTLSTISQLYRYEGGNWDYALMDRLSLPTRLFAPIIQPGTRCGTILSSICNDLHIDTLPLVSVGAHDTASAIAAIPEPDNQVIYISSGTWSIVGTETQSPIINDKSFKYNYSNEGGVGGKIRLLKNVMGMWILQEIQRRFAIEGRNYSFNELSELAQAATPFGPVIDPDDTCFYEPTNMPEMIQNYCLKTGQKVPQTDGEIVRAALDSLALKYRYVIEQLERLVGRSLGGIYIVGGGSKNKLLCQLTANCCNRTVYAGPVEATALGNAVTQLIALGELSDLRQARELIKQCFPPLQFEPQSWESWDDHYHNFLNIIELS